MADSTNTIDTFDAYRYEDGGLIPYFHKDRNGKVISQEVEGGEFSIYNNMIVLQDIPDMRYGLTVRHGGVELQQSKKPSRALEQNEYRVDSSTGFVFFHPSLEGEVVEVSNYYGRGFWLVPDNRVLTSIIRRPDGSYDYESLKDLMDGIKGYYYLEEFDPQRQYIKNNQVTYHGTTYIAVCEEPEAGVTPPERPDMWRIFAGGYGVLQDYDNSRSYVTRDLVRYEYAIYLCIKNSDGGISPADTQHWMRLLSIKEMVDWWEETKGQIDDALEKVDSFDALLNKKQNEWIVTTAGTGAAYTATLDPAPAALYTGMKITVIPHTVSTSTSATLNVNGLGAKYFRQRGYTTGSLYTPYSSSFLSNGKPVTLIYDGTYWVMTEYSKPYWYDVQSRPSSFTPSSHASTSTTYGAASNTNYGHTRISNSGSTTMSSTSTTDSGARAEAYKTVYNTSCDLNNYITEGSWSFDSLTSATNFPSELTWTGKLSSSHLTVKVMYYRSSTDWLVQQKLVHTVLNTEYVRSGMHSGSSAIWNKWQKIEVEEEIPIIKGVKINNWSYGNYELFIDFSNSDPSIITKNDLPRKFGLQLYANPAIFLSDEYGKLDNAPVQFLFSENNDYKTEEPNEAYSIVKYVTSGSGVADANSYTSVYGYDFGLQGYDRIYYFEKNDNEFRLLNPIPIGRSIVRNNGVDGYGLSRVLNRLNRSEYYTGEALSAYQGYRLDQRTNNTTYAISNDNGVSFVMDSKDPSLPSNSTYAGLRITIYPDISSTSTEATLRMSSEAVGLPFRIRTINNELVKPSVPDFIQAGVPMMLLCDGNYWNILNMVNDSGNTSGDYLPLTGGTISGNLNMTGNLTLKGSGNYGNKINFGDGDYCHIYEPTDDHLEIKGSSINFVTNRANGFTVNDKDILAGYIGTTDTSGTTSDYSITYSPVPSITTGMIITIIPDKTSTSTEITLNVNGTGVKNIKRIYTNDPTVYYSPVRLNQNKPVRLQYDGTYWIQIDYPKAWNGDFYMQSFTVGTSCARPIYAGTTAMTSGTTALTTGKIYLQYE